MEYFSKNNPLVNSIKNSILAQNSYVCREQISGEYIKKSFGRFDFGYVNKSRRLKKKYGKNEETINSFVLARYIYDDTNLTAVTIHIELLCSSEANKMSSDGSKLLKLIEDKCSNENINVITLEALKEKNLRNWYISKGFVQTQEIEIKNTKVYSMLKVLR